MTDKSGNDAQKASSSYSLPAHDREFLLGDTMRGVRFLLEYSKADQVLRDWKVRSTIVVFGSARAHPNGGDPGKRWYETAREFARIVSREGGALDDGSRERHNVIATGGGPGIMEAANRGASDVGAPNIGYNITLPLEQDPNPYSTPDLTFQFHYFAMRKMHLAMRANALAVFPGGFGTLDEMFEILTLRQTEKMAELPIVIVDKAYWTSVINFEALADAGTINREDLDLFSFADSAQEAWDILVAHGVMDGPKQA